MSKVNIKLRSQNLLLIVLKVVLPLSYQNINGCFISYTSKTAGGQAAMLVYGWGNGTEVMYTQRLGNTQKILNAW